MQTIQNNHENSESVVVKSSDYLNNSSFLMFGKPFLLTQTHDLSNSMSIDYMMYKHDDNIYSLMTSQCILDKLKIHAHILLPKIGLIDKISLIDFPISQYILSLNNCNVATANHNNIFDIAKSSSNMFSFFKQFTMENEHIENKNSYINLGKIDYPQIILSKQHKLNDKYIIKMNGYVYNNNVNELVYDNFTVDVYPHNTYSLFIKHVTASIDIASDKCGIVILIIDNIKYEINVSDKLSRISFTNNDLVYQGNHNEYLNDDINKHTLNFSKLGTVYLIPMDCSITKLYQNYYNAYSYPEHKEIFV